MNEAEPLVYLDSSALVKLVVAEPESEALRREVSRATVLVSEIALAEVPRAIWRVRTGRTAREQEGLLAGMEAVMAGVALIPLNRELLVTAGAFKEAFLRTLDAIHVAAALTVSDELDAFVTYDARQAEVAAYAGLTLLAPA